MKGSYRWIWGVVVIVALGLIAIVGYRARFSAQLASSDMVFVTATPAPQETVAEAERAGQTQADPALLEGSWAGEFKFENEPEWVLLTADFTSDPTGLTVKVIFPLHEDIAPASGSVSFNKIEAGMAKVDFAIPFQRPNNQDRLRFEGQLQDNKIVGLVSQGHAKGTFELTPLADFAPDVFEGRT